MGLNERLPIAGVQDDETIDSDNAISLDDEWIDFGFLHALLTGLDPGQIRYRDNRRRQGLTIALCMTPKTANGGEPPDLGYHFQGRFKVGRG